MENRKPFELRKVLIVYNFAQVIFSAWLFYEVNIQIFHLSCNKNINLILFKQIYYFDFSPVSVDG